MEQRYVALTDIKFLNLVIPKGTILIRDEKGARAKKLKNAEGRCYVESQYVKGAIEVLPLRVFTKVEMDFLIKHFNIDIDIAYECFDRTGWTYSQRPV